MKRLITFLFILFCFSGFGQPLLRNYFTTNPIGPSALSWTNNASFIWPYGEPAPDPNGILPGPHMAIHSDGTLLVGTNVMADGPFSGIKVVSIPYAVNMTDSNEIPVLQSYMVVTDSENYHNYVQAEQWNQSGPSIWQSYGDYQVHHNGNSAVFDWVMDPDNGSQMVMKTNGVNLWWFDQNGFLWVNQVIASEFKASVGLLVHSNTLASLPVLSKGDNFYWSSNGVAYVTQSDPSGVLTTNLVPYGTTASGAAVATTNASGVVNVLASNSVPIASASITIVTNFVTGGVTYTFSTIGAPPTGAASGALGGTYPAPVLAAGDFSTNLIVKGFVETNDAGARGLVFTNGQGTVFMGTNSFGLMFKDGTTSQNSPLIALDLTNTVPAVTGGAAANQEYSPLIRLTGNGWKTTATAGSQPVSFFMGVVPVQGTTSPTGLLTISNTVNAGTPTGVALWDTSGNLTNLGAVYFGPQSTVSTVDQFGRANLCNVLTAYGAVVGVSTFAKLGFMGTYGIGQADDTFFQRASAGTFAAFTNFSAMGWISTTNGFVSYATNIVNSIPSAGFTNDVAHSYGTNTMIVDIIAIGETVAFYNRIGTSGQTSCGILLFTDTGIANKEYIVGVNCGVAFSVGTLTSGTARAF